MKNLLKIFALAAVASTLLSCETKPSTLSYTLIGTFDYMDASVYVDSVYYAPGFYMDQLSALNTKCTEVNQGFTSGWRISKKYGSSEDSYEMKSLTSAGKGRGYGTAPYQNGAYAVFTMGLDRTQMATYDIYFNVLGFSKANCKVSGMQINNTKTVEELYKAGEVVSGDYLKVTAEFYKDGSVVWTDEKYLVDYTGAEAKVITDWESWSFDFKDASSTNVDAIRFNVTSSAPDRYPLNFCMDYFVASFSLEY
jgi:hypothetical protein